MTNYGGNQLQNQKDSTMIFEVGFMTQEFASFPEVISSRKVVSADRLNSTLAIILRYWNWLRRNATSYTDLQEWNLKHFPSQFSEKVYRPILQKDLKRLVLSNQLLLEEIIHKDYILKKAGVESISVGSDIDSKLQLFFPSSGLTKISTFYKSIKHDPRDLALAKQFAAILNSQLEYDIVALAICPTEGDCLAAQATQLNYWLKFIQDLKREIEQPGLSPQIIDQSAVKMALSNAFKCGLQIKKLNEFRRYTPTIARQIHEIATRQNFDEIDKSPILETIDNETFSKRIEKFLQLANILSAFIGLIDEFLRRCEILDKALDAEDLSWAESHYSDLAEVGINKSDIDKTRKYSRDQEWDAEIKTVNDILTYISRLKKYLGEKGLPIEYIAGAVLSPLDLLNNWEEI